MTKPFGIHNKNIKALQNLAKNNQATREEMEQLTQYVQLERIKNFKNYVVSMDYDIDWQWFHWVLVEIIDKMIASPVSKRLLIEIPPRHCKTLIAGILLSTYLFGRFPDKNIIYGTANNDKAVSEASNMRSVITSKRYQDLFPDTKIKSSLDDIGEISKSDRKNKKDTASVMSNLTSDRGSIRVAGMGDMLSGHPGHFLIGDDFYKGYAEAQSDKIRETIWQWFWTVFMARIDKSTIGQTAHAVVFFTRWHDDDISGRIQKIQNENRDEIQKLVDKGIPWTEWEVISFEAIKTSTKISHPSDKRADGEPLWGLYEPEYYSQKINNPVMFEAIYQGNPINKMGKIFERHYFREYDTLPKDISRIVISIDPNLKEGKFNSETNQKSKSDNFAIVVHGVYGNNIYLLDYVAKSKNYQMLKLETIAMIRKYIYYWACIIEQTASGPALTSDLKLYANRIFEFSPGSKSKFEKASLVVPTMMSGNYFVPSKRLMPNVDTFINQFLSFTGEPGKHDDIVDATVIALLYYMQNKTIMSVNFISVENTNSIRGQALGNNKVNIASLLPSMQKRNVQRRVEN